MNLPRSTRYRALRILRQHPAFAGRDARFRRAILIVVGLQALFLLSCLLQALRGGGL